MESTASEHTYTIFLCPRLIRCWAAVNMPSSSSMEMVASKPFCVGVLMPMIGTWMRLSCWISFGSTPNDVTNTASTLRRTGRFVKKSRRFSAVSTCWNSDTSYPALCMTDSIPANTSVLNQLVISSFISIATRYDWPDFSDVAEREMLKSSLSAVSSTLRRVRSDTSSGRVNARDTVEIDTPAALATSRMPALSISQPLCGFCIIITNVPSLGNTRLSGNALPYCYYYTANVVKNHANVAPIAQNIKITG